MRRVCVCCLALLLALSVPLSSQSGAGYEALTIAGTAVGLTATTYTVDGGTARNICRGRLETAQVRFRYDGTNPTASEGTVLEVGDLIELRDNRPSGGVNEISAIRFIRTGSTSGVLRLHCVVGK